MLYGLLFFSAFSCEEEEPSQVNNANINFHFRLLNKNGKPATNFQQGENFVFSFLIINNSDQLWVFHDGFGKNGKIDESSDFCRVYKVNSDLSDNKDELIDMGKPWETMFCTFQLGTPIDPNDTLKLEIPWMPSPWNISNPYLMDSFALRKITNHCLQVTIKPGFQVLSIFLEKAFLIQRMKKNSL